MLRGERDHRRGPAKRRRHCRAVEIVGADDAGGRALLDVAVAVDTAWQDQTPTRIDLTGAWSQILAEGRHDTVSDADVAGGGVGRGRYCAVADHQVELAHPGL